MPDVARTNRLRTDVQRWRCFKLDCTKSNGKVVSDYFTPLISRYQKTRLTTILQVQPAYLANRCRLRTPPLRGAGNGAAQNCPGSMITELVKPESRARRHDNKRLRRLCQVHHVLQQCIYPRHRNVTNQEVGRSRQQTER